MTYGWQDFVFVMNNNDGYATNTQYDLSVQFLYTALVRRSVYYGKMNSLHPLRLEMLHNIYKHKYYGDESLMMHQMYVSAVIDDLVHCNFKNAHEIINEAWAQYQISRIVST